MKIIKSGITKNTTYLLLPHTCPNCECVFQPEEGDSVSHNKSIATGKFVPVICCPECRNLVELKQRSVL